MDIEKKEADEMSRLDALGKYNILDTLTEQDYEDITYMASIICNTPISLISFVDKDRQWFKAHTGLQATETLREYSFCAHALAKPEEILIVSNAREDERFRTNPMVTGDPNIVLYAGVPLVNAEGFGLGTVCVIDKKPRELSDQQLKALRVLASQVMNLLELRKKDMEFQLVKLQLEIRNKDLEQFAMVVAHDIKSPLTSVLLANQMLSVQFGEDLGKPGLHMVDIATKSANKIKDLVDGILSYYRGDINPETTETFGLDELLDAIKQTLSSPKKYSIHYSNPGVTICMNKTQLEQIFFNLINNSIRYNDKTEVEINILFSEDSAYYYFTIKDNGIGISTENQEKVFNLFSTLSTADQFGVKGSGIGLPTVKKIVENHGGTIQIASETGDGTAIGFKIKKTG